nr:hypothetical protein BaRGS_027412 [Batillaria attramentaria]
MAGLLLCFFLLSTLLAVASPSGLNSTLTYSGSYEIRINNKQWLNSADAFVVADGIRYGNNNSAIFSGQVPGVDSRLLLKSAQDRKGQDTLGDFRAMRYDKDVIIISPLTKVMAVSPWHRQWKAGYPRYPITEGQSYWGLDRDLVSVPPGFKAEVILLYSPDGVGKALETWGKALRRYHGTSGVTPPATPFVDKLGYWTGKGSFFYNNTKELDVFNYEQIVLAVKMFADRHQVPLGSVEIDDWWYESVITPDAVVTWDANKTSARVSAPYMDKDHTDQWKVGVTSAFAGALGLAAFKDTFWSHVQEVDNPYGLNETYPGLQAAVATLSMGSVAIGDSVDPLDFVPPVSKPTKVHLLGENKFVPLSPQRVLYVNLTLGVSLVLQGQPGENVKMTYYVGSDRRPERRHDFVRRQGGS